MDNRPTIAEVQEWVLKLYKGQRIFLVGKLSFKRIA